VTAAIAALKAENEAFRDRIDAQLSQKYDQRRERLLLSAVQTLETLDRAVDAARATDAAEALISGVMLVRTQLFRLLQEEGLERMSVLGLPYDRRTSEVVQRRPVGDPDQDGLVIEELQGGHHIRGHVLRRAKVVVGEFTDEFVEPTVVMKAYEGETDAKPEPTAAMPVVDVEPTVAMPALTTEPTAAMPALTPEPTVAMPALDPEPAVPMPAVKADTPYERTSPMPAVKDSAGALERTAAGRAATDENEIEPTVSMPALGGDAPPKDSAGAAEDVPPAENTVAMPAREIEAVMAAKAGAAPPAGKTPAPSPKAAPTPPVAQTATPGPPPVPSPPRIPPPPRASAPPPRPAPPAPATPPPEAEEPIVVEDWTDPTQVGAPASTIGGPARAAGDADWSETQTDAPARQPRRGPSPTPPAEEAGDDDGAGATMVLADSASLFARPGPGATPAPPRIPPAAAPAAASGEADEWDTPGQWEGDPNATHPVPRNERVAAPRPPVARPAPAATTPAPRPRATVPPSPPARRPPGVAEPGGSSVRRRPAPTAPPTPAMPGHALRSPASTGAAVSPPSRAPRRGRGPAFYAGVSFVALVLLTALGIEMWLLLRPKPRPSVAEASPAADDAVQPPVPATTPAPIIEDVITVPQPEPEPEVTEPDLVPTAPPLVSQPTPGPPLPTIPTPVAVTTPPPPRPTTPAPVVNPVPALLAQADQAREAGKFGDAIRLYGEVLKVEPDNKQASVGRLRATGDRASVGRYFLTAVTMSEGKASGGGIPGFSGAQVVKSQCECAITYEVTPANPRQDEPYSVGIYLENDSKRDIKPQSLTAIVAVNGSRATKQIPLQTREVPRGERVLIGKLDDTWKLGTTSWSLEAAVGAGGNTYRAQLTWELKL
jgi:hypothetical protein